MSTFENTSSLRTIEAEISKNIRTMQLRQYLLVFIFKKRRAGPNAG